MAYKKSESTRSAILSAARVLFAEKGYYSTEIKDIAKAMGIAHTGIYYYFKNKEDIASEIYIQETMAILDDVEQIRRQRPCSELFLCILQYLLMTRRLAYNPVTADYFFDMIDYRPYGKEDMKRVRTTYYAHLDALFKSCGKHLSDDEMTIYILTSDAYAKALISAMRSGIIDYSVTDAIDHFFRHLLLPDLNLSFDEYRAAKEEVLRYLEQ